MRILSNSEKTDILNKSIQVNNSILEYNKMDYLINRAKMESDNESSDINQKAKCENTKDLVSQENITDFKPDDLLYIKWNSNSTTYDCLIYDDVITWLKKQAPIGYEGYKNIQSNINGAKYFITSKSVNLILSKKYKHFNAIKYGTKVLLRNEEIIYELEPAPTIEETIKWLQKYGIKTTINDIDKITSLSLNEKKIVDVSPLKTLINLQELYLSGNEIVDVSPLKTLTNLQKLWLQNNKIADISPLSTLTNLQTLYLSYNKIVDVSPLSTLTNLQTLYLFSNKIVDVSPLKTLITLQELSLFNNQIVDVSPLKTLTTLQELILIDNKIEDISPLSSLIDLKKLYLDGNKIEDISPLSSLIDLKELYLDGNKIEDISPLSLLINLEKFGFVNNEYRIDIDVIFSLPKLKYVNLFGSEYEIDVSKLPKDLILS